MSAATTNENFDRWVEVLATTDLPQVDSALARRIDDGVIGYCCLGVGCTLSPELEEYANPGTVHTLPPLAFYEWIGLSIERGPDEDVEAYEDRLRDHTADLVIDWPDGFRCQGDPYDERDGYVDDSMTAATLNDGGFSFAQIADCLRYFGVRGITS